MPETAQGEEETFIKAFEAQCLAGPLDTTGDASALLKKWLERYPERMMAVCAALSRSREAEGVLIAESVHLEQQAIL